MKIKTILSLTSFVSAFAIGLIIFTLSTFNIFTNFFQKDIDSAAKAKIYSVLKQDTQNRKNMVAKIFNREAGDHTTFFKAITDLGEETENIDLSGTPEDFQIAWKEYAATRTEWANLINHLDNLPNQGSLTKAEAKIAERKIAEQNIAWKNVVLITESYGFEFDKNVNVIEKNLDN